MSLFQSATGIWRGPATATPKALFAAGELGTVINFDALASLSQDNAGASPITAPAQTIGRAMDRTANANHLAQANAGLRPKWGRAPISRRNIIPNSSVLTASPWGVTLSSRALSASPASDGSMTAYDWVPNTGAAIGAAKFSAALPNKTDDVYTFSVEVKSAGLGSVEFKFDSGTASSSAAFNFGTGAFMTINTNIDRAMAVALPSGYYRLSLTLDMTKRISDFGVVLLSNATVGDGVNGLTIARWQCEKASVETPYQKTLSAFDMTESGYPAYGYSRLDLSDDMLATTFPIGFTGDVALFGRLGSRLISGQTFANGGTLTIGPTTATGFAAGTLAALGDLVGALAISRALSVPEKAKLLAYYAAQGAGGWI